MGITGLNHITFSTNNLERSYRFYREVLGLKPLCKWERGAYLLAGETWICLSLNKKKLNLSHKDYRHIAFSVSSKTFKNLRSSLLKNGAKEWSKDTSEGDSFYFLDPDGHHLEIHVGNWKTRMASLRKKPYPGEFKFLDREIESSETPVQKLKAKLKLNRPRLNENYFELVKFFPLIPIKNQTLYKSAMILAEFLITILNEGLKDKGFDAYLKALVHFISEYEQQKFPSAPVDTKTFSEQAQKAFKKHKDAMDRLK